MVVEYFSAVAKIKKLKRKGKKLEPEMLKK